MADWWKYLTGAALATGVVVALTREDVEALDEADIILSNLVILPTSIMLGESATAFVEATNTGGQRGKYTVTLVMDNLSGFPVTVQKDVTLDPLETKDVSFNLVPQELGIYTIYVNGEQEELVVGSVPYVDPFPFKCPECPLEFATQAELNTHYMDVHFIQPPVNGEEVYIPGRVTCEIIWGPESTVGYPTYSGPCTCRDWELVATNVSDYGQLFTIEIGEVQISWTVPAYQRFVSFQTYENVFLAAHESAVIGTGTWRTSPRAGYAERLGWQSWKCELSGPTSSLANFSGSYTMTTFRMSPALLQFYAAVLPSITNLTDQWQSLKVKHDPVGEQGYSKTEYLAFAPSQTIVLPMTIFDVEVNDMLWLATTYIEGSVVDVIVYDIWY